MYSELTEVSGGPLGGTEAAEEDFLAGTTEQKVVQGWFSSSARQPVSAALRLELVIGWPPIVS